MSIDFDPVPLRPRRRRVDPIVVGVVVVALALGAAVLKPWETRPGRGGARRVGPRGGGEPVRAVHPACLAATRADGRPAPAGLGRDRARGDAPRSPRRPDDRRRAGRHRPARGNDLWRGLGRRGRGRRDRHGAGGQRGPRDRRDGPDLPDRRRSGRCADLAGPRRRRPRVGGRSPDRAGGSRRVVPVRPHRPRWCAVHLVAGRDLPDRRARCGRDPPDRRGHPGPVRAGARARCHGHPGRRRRAGRGE